MKTKIGSYLLAGAAWCVVFALALMMVGGQIQSTFMVWFFWLFFLVVAIAASAMNLQASPHSVKGVKNLLRGQTLFIRDVNEETNTITFSEKIPPDWTTGDSLSLK